MDQSATVTLRCADAGPLETASGTWSFLILCVAILAVAVAPVLTAALAFAPFYDTPHLTSPLFCEMGRHFLQGRFPLFDWTILEPVSHNAHFSPLYPFFFIGLFNYCSLMPSIAGHDMVAVFHLAVMFGNTVVLGRVARLPLAGAIFAALLFTASANAFVLAQWPTLVAPGAWLPLAAAGLLSVLDRGSWLRGTAMIGAGFGAMLLAAPATNLTASFVAFALMLSTGRLVAAFADGSWRRLLLPWIACAVASAVVVVWVGTGTTGNLLVALDDLIRWNRTGYVIGREVTADFTREILVEQRGILDLASVLLPLRVPFAVGNFFIGPVVACLAVLGAVDGRREWLVQTLAAMLCLCLFLVFLDPVGVALVWSYVPGLNHTRHLSLLAGPFMIAGSLLAARGLAVVLRPEASGARRAMAITLAVAGLLLGIASAVLYVTEPAVLTDADSNLGPARLGAVLGAWVAAFLLLSRGNRLAVAHPGRLAVLLVLSCAVTTVPLLHTRLRSIGQSPVGLRTWQDLDRMVERLVSADPGPHVFVFHGSITSDGFNYTTAGTAARLHGAPTFQYFHSPRVHWKFFAQNYLFPDFAAYGRLGGRYVLSEGPLEDPLLEAVGQEQTTFAYRIRNSRELVFASCGAALPVDMGAPRTRLRPSQLPLAPPNVLEAGRAADAAPGACSGDPVGGIRIDRSKDALRFELAPSDTQILLLSLPPYDGWRLSIGGRGIPLFALDDSRLVAVVPAGVSGPAALIFRPIPVMIRMGIGTTGVAFLLLFFLWLAWRRPGHGRLLCLPRLRGSTRPVDILQTSSDQHAAPPSASTG